MPINDPNMHRCGKCGQMKYREQMNSTLFYGDICDYCMMVVEEEADRAEEDEEDDR